MEQRQAMLGTLRKWVARTKRHPKQKFGLLVIRLAPGSAAESVLEQVRSLVRLEDTTFLLSDTSLGILVSDLRHLSDPLRVGRRLLATRSGELERVGIAYFDAKFEGADQLLIEAELASTRAAPRDCLYSDPRVQSEAEVRLEFEDALRRSLRDGTLRAHYQPIVDLGNGRITGFEALVRWKHPSRGWLLPEEFLDVADSCGILAELDRFVLSRSLEQLERWSREDREIRVSVNLCFEHFLEAGGVDRLRPILDAHQGVLSQLRIDISERVLMEEQGLAALKQLHNLKVGFHLDDFGVGPDSFHCLGSFPFNSLKVDRTLIAEMEEEVNAELITAVLRIAQRMKMRTIAEGVVTHAQLEELRNLGCNEAQGFLFARAVDAASALELLTQDVCW